MVTKRFVSLRKLQILLILALAVAFMVITQSVKASPPAPQPLPPTGDCYRDNVFYGAIPPGGEQSPVLVFVHGLGGLASDWWVNVPGLQVNDMYDQAYEAGYRTAFVNLNVNPDAPGCAVERRPAKDMLYNGRVLSRQLDAIAQYYGVEQVDIVAHSKGGIDAQAAIVWWGAWRKARRVFTLGSPHQGSLVADLLWSPEGFWVSLILGERDDATFSLQTSSMRLFRTLTDVMPMDDGIRYYSGAGNFWNTPGTLYPLIGRWLQDQPGGGDNDGVVTVASTSLPGAATLFLEPWNHSEVYVGRNAFPYIHRILSDREPGQHSVYLPLVISAVPEASLALAASGGQIAMAQGTNQSPRPLESNFILRGGLLPGRMTERIPIEPEARSAQFLLLTTGSEGSAALQGPDGSRHPLQPIPPMSLDVLGSAFALGYGLSDPDPGEWTIEMEGPARAAYLLCVMLDSSLRVELEGLPDVPILPGQEVRLAARAQVGTDPVPVSQLRLQTGASPSTTRAYPTVARDGASLSHAFESEGLYNISITVIGQTMGRAPFERTFIRSLAVLSAGKLGNPPAMLTMLSGR
jgi:pimeloyl-ACP methyl ester carboxylesterase